MIPPIALVAGILRDPAARPLVPQLGPGSLIPFYTVLALPFTFRALDAGVRAIDVKTLVDASRSLGAGWGTTLLPGTDPEPAHRDRRPRRSSPATVVLGEFTIASVLLKDTFPTVHGDVPAAANRRAGWRSASLALVATTALLTVLTLLTRKRGAARAGRHGLLDGTRHDERTHLHRRPQDVRRRPSPSSTSTSSASRAS